MINLLSAILLFIGSIVTAIGLVLLYFVWRIKRESEEVEIRDEK